MFELSKVMAIKIRDGEVGESNIFHMIYKKFSILMECENNIEA
jgi:hypothetical protein